MDVKLGGVLITVLMLSASCWAADNTQGLSASYQEFTEYFSGVAQNKPINWTMAYQLVHAGQVSRLCFDQSVKLHNDTAEFKTYAGRMLDSTGKMPSGLFRGNWIDFGSFQGCTVDSNSAPDLPANFRATYCRLSWGGIPQELAAGSRLFRQGVCVPNSCTDVDVTLLANTGLLGLKPMASWQPQEVLCQREEDYETYSDSAVVAISVISVILLMLVLSTLYEFVITTCLTEGRRKDLAESNVGRFLMCFSVYNNTKKVFNTYQPPGQLPAIHGIRVISCLLIIYGHVVMSLVARLGNTVDWMRLLIRMSFPLNSNIDLAVDTFFLLSGLMASYLLLKRLKKSGGVFTFGDLVLFYAHRYIRLTPVYAFVLMIYACLFIYMGTGPCWADPTLFAMSDFRGCPSSYWANLLYINNYFHREMTCFHVTWSLAIDMQLFIVTPGILLLLYKRPKWGTGLTVFLLVLSWVVNAVKYQTWERYSNDKQEGLFNVTYKDTLCRLGPYMIGILLGYLLFKTNRKVSNTQYTKMLMFLSWMVAFSAFCLLVIIPKVTFLGFELIQFELGPTAVPTTTFDNPGWSAVYRSLFAASVGWVVYACSVGYGGIITEFLSWSGWVPLSRLSYAAFLVHLIIIRVYNMSQKTVMFFSVADRSFMSLSLICLTFLFAFVATIMVEIPFNELEKLIFPRARGRQDGSTGSPVGVKGQQGNTNAAHVQTPGKVSADVGEYNAKVMDADVSEELSVQKKQN